MCECVVGLHRAMSFVKCLLHEILPLNYESFWAWCVNLSTKIHPPCYLDIGGVNTAHNFNGTVHLQSNAKNSAHPIFFPFALKTVKSRVLDMKDIVARALIYSTLHHYIGLDCISIRMPWNGLAKGRRITSSLKVPQTYQINSNQFLI